MQKNRGFTLIELLMVVAIIGIIAAIAIPNLLDSIQRARQKRTVGDIRTMCIAMQAFTVDYGGYPAPNYSGDPTQTWPLIVDDSGAPVVIPDLIQAIPVHDAWKMPFTFVAGPLANGGQTLPQLNNEPLSIHFCVYSLGSDQVPSTLVDGSAPAPALALAWCQDPSMALGVLTTHCFEADIVWGDSHFQQSPDGKQKRCT